MPGTETSYDGAPEAIAARFHETYERLAPEFGYETRRDSAVPWTEVPLANRRLMIAVVRDLMFTQKAIEVPFPGARADLTESDKSLLAGWQDYSRAQHDSDEVALTRLCSVVAHIVASHTCPGSGARR